MTVREPVTGCYRITPFGVPVRSLLGTQGEPERHAETIVLEGKSYRMKYQITVP